jgi:glucose-1-phosphate thymidylyltransferase
MKGIILAGGSGTRLYPLTSIMSKQLLPVYDKPMICYPLSTLMLLGIKDILIISTPQDTPLIQKYLKDGSDLGISLQYIVQEQPKGIAEAFILGRDFIGADNVTLILGDNIFNIGSQMTEIAERTKKLSSAVIFGYHVKDPERFGVIEFDAGSLGVVKSLVEKPVKPTSNYAAVGLYCYPNDVVEKVVSQKPSARGELEITDLNNTYLSEGRLEAVRMRRGAAWLDAGTPESLLEASQYIAAIDHRQGLKVACLEEVAYRMGYISRAKLASIIADIPAKTSYCEYLQHVLEDVNL